MAFFETQSDGILTTVLIALGIVLVVGVLVVVAIKVHHANKEEKQKQTAQAIEEGVQKRLMEIRDEYLVMARNTTYVAGVDGEIAAGKYILKSSVSSEHTFNLRLNGLVQQYSDGDIIMLVNSDTICPVSGSVLIKPYVDEAITDEKPQ